MFHAIRSRTKINHLTAVRVRRYEAQSGLFIDCGTYLTKSW